MLALCAICRRATCSHSDLEFAGLVQIPTHAPQAPAREGVTLPVRSFEPHTPLRDRAGPSDLAAHTQPNAL
jgi:hypothetical protein